MDLSRFQDAFFEESAEHVAAMEQGLLQLEKQPDDLNLLNRIFRPCHSIKGNSGMFGYSRVGEFTHAMENILDALRTGQMTVTNPLIDLLLDSTDAVKGLLDAVKSNTEPDEAIVAPLLERLREYKTGTTAPASTSGTRSSAAPSDQRLVRREYEIVWVPAPTIFQQGLDPKQIVRELGRLGDLTTKMEGVDSLPALESMDPERCHLSWTFVLLSERPRSEIEAVFEFVSDGSHLTIVERAPGEGRAAASLPDVPQRLGEILVEEGVVTKETLDEALSEQRRVGQILVEKQAATPQQVSQALVKQQQQEAATQSKKTDTGTIRVDTAKIDKLINLMGELVITQSMLNDVTANFEISRLSLLQERVGELDRNTRDIQERVMGIRMMPIGTVFNRLPRLVRDLATKNAKKIQLVVSGEETELDKSVIESIGDPLTHLLRNSADHGLEYPKERMAAGKPEMGTISLNAFHEGGNVCITVEDDGQGLNQEKIHAKAVALGLITAAEKLTEDQVCGLIFRPGFSTADQVTDVSGRGVGMDVVRKNIELLGGVVTTRSTPGKGTKFTLKLPLTLAIIDGQTVRVGVETYIVPLTSIIKSIQPTAAEVKTVTGRGELVNVAGVYHPMLRLYEVFGVEPELTDPTKAILTILEAEGERVAVMVDELLGQQQAVIKTLDKNFRKVQGLAGATILGDGTVGFILDVRGLLELARQGEAVGV